MRNAAGACTSACARAPGPVHNDSPPDAKVAFFGALFAAAEVHDYHDELTGVLAAALAKRAPGYTSLGFPDPRRLAHTPSAGAANPERERYITATTLSPG